jgi:hypothetical protein
MQEELDGSVIKLYLLIGRDQNSMAMARLMRNLWCPAILQISFSDARLDQELVSLRAVAALTSFRDAHGGVYPDALEELVPAFAKEIPEDTFVERPLNYIREGSGFVLYSVGGDFIDQGGLDQGKVGLGDDLVVRVRQ